MRANVLRFLGRAGYTEVETAGHYDWTAAQFRAELKAAGLSAVSGHDGPDFTARPTGRTPTGRRSSTRPRSGQKYTGCAWFPGPVRRASTVARRSRRSSTRRASSRAEYDLQFFYHNHDFEFVNNRSTAARSTTSCSREADRRLVKFELDLFWITEGGANGVEYLRADPSRYFAYHVKDHVWGDRPDEADFEDVGPGMLDFPDLFDGGRRNRGLDKHFFIEHDSPWLSHPNDPEAEFKTARAGIQYLETVRWYAGTARAVSSRPRSRGGTR